MSDHRAEAERLLAFAADKKNLWDAQWVQAYATMALAHATLAASEPTLSPGPSRAEIALALHEGTLESDDPSASRTPAADALPEVVVFQGAAVKDYGPVGQLAKSEPFTLRDSINLWEHLDDE